MSRLYRFLLVSALVVFALACNLVTRPIDDVQNLAGTAEALASAMPAETLFAVASQIPVETFKALPSVIPSGIPELEKYVDPQGTPAPEWNGIPIMPQAVAGEAVEQNTYSFKANVTVQAAYDFYNEHMAGLGWSLNLGVPASELGGLLVFSKEDAVLTITMTTADDATVVILALT